MYRSIAIAGLAITAALTATPSPAQDALKLAIPMRGNWETAAPDLGARAGIFKKHGITFESVYTQGAGETLQVVISGSADIGVGVGTSAAMAAYVKGAPVRVIGNSTTGTNDLYWYVRTESPIKSLKDATEKHTIAYSTSGSTSNNTVLAFINDLGVKAKPTATGGPPGTFTAVMSGQVDIGWSAPPFGLQEEKDGKIRIIARGSDATSLHGQTIRVLIVNADALKNRKDAIMRFMQGYRETVDWMYSSPDAVRMYAEKTKLPQDLVKASIEKYHTKDAMQTDAMKDIDGIMRDAVTLKFLDKPLSKEQLADLIQIPPR
jgi:NitT/TauT family transport system substrate-binding protein